VPAQMLLEHVTVLASRCELDMAPRRRLGTRRLLRWWGCLGGWGGYLGLWWGCLGWWCGCVGLGSGCLGWWCGCRRPSRGGPRRAARGGEGLFWRRWRCRGRRRHRVYRLCRDLWLRRNLPHGGWPDQCGERRAVCARFRPALPVVFRRVSLIDH